MRRIVGKPTKSQAKAAETSPAASSKSKSHTTPPSSGGAKKEKFSLDKLQKIKEEREARRNAQKDAKTKAETKAKAYKDAGIVGDVDFIEMIEEWKHKHPLVTAPHVAEKNAKMCVCVRKRPLNYKELARQEHDCLTVANPYAVIHESKTAVDQNKFLNNLNFKFDHVFGEESETSDLYEACIHPLVDFMMEGGYSTVFAYGQTGSGKTFTMGQAQSSAVKDLFKLLNKQKPKDRFCCFAACFEIYGPKCQDLLNNRERLDVMEDSKGKVEVVGLAKVPVATAEELESLLEEAMSIRTTTKTDANDTSSRSHSIIQIFLHPPGDENAEQPLCGMMSVVDLAGSERGQDTKSHNRQLRTEAAEINKSLLALKECIRAMQVDGAHVSFRASKLTQVLKASFTSKKAMTVMVAAVSPAADSADHTINTLRYADRVKEKAGGAKVVLPIDHNQRAINGEQLNMDDEEEEEDNGGGGGGADDDDEDDNVQEDEEEEAVVESDPAYEAAVDQLNEAEEQLLAAHIGAVERNAVMCVEEGKLLAGILDKSVVDYDIDEYADKLEVILLQRLSTTNELQRRLADFRSKSRAEETVSRKTWAKPKGVMNYEP